MKQKQGYWHRSFDVDPILKMLRLKGKEKEGFVFVIVKGFYSMMQHDLNKELLYLEFHEYHTEIDFLIKERYITITRNSKNPKVKIKSMQNHYIKTTQKEKLQHTPPLNSSDTIKVRVEENRIEESKVEEKPCDALLFSDFKVFNNWLEKAFDSTNKSNTKFQRDSYDIFTRYRRTDWKNKNGEQIQNKKGICIAAMKAKKYKLKL